MNFGEYLLTNCKWTLLSARRLRFTNNRSLVRYFYRKSRQRQSKKNESNAAERRLTEILPGKTQSDIFGATILPQNLSFEDSKKLSENQIRLEDIPLVDENAVAEALAIEKMNIKRQSLSRRKKANVETEVIKKEIKSEAELFWIADPFENIPGPKFLQSLVKGLKKIVCQLTVVSLFQFMKKNTYIPFRTYGPIVKIPEILGGKIILISRPDHMSAIFEQDRRQPVNTVLDSIQRLRMLCRETRNEDFHLIHEWNNLKNTINEPALYSLEKYFYGIDEAAEKFIRRIKSIRNRQNEVPDNFLFEINKWSLECLCFAMFDRSFGFLDHDFASSPSKISQLLYSLTMVTKKLCYLESGFQFWRFMNTASLNSMVSAYTTLDNIISEYVGQVQLHLIKKRKELNEEHAINISVVERLLLQENVTPKDVVFSIIDILLIGMNTMSTALGFLFYHLSMNRRVQSEVWKEVKRILPEKYSKLEYETLGSFTYIQACLKESLRLKMPMPVIMRILSQNVTVANYQIPKGTFVLMTAQVECMKEDNFDDPMKFFPERWLEKDMRHPFACLPVGNYFEDSLPRQLAEISVWMCASLVLRHFFVDYFYGDIQGTSSALSFPNKPLKFTFLDRAY